MINLLIPKQARVSETDQKSHLWIELKMRVPVKLLGFVFWLFFFNCGQCQECPREEITHENTEPLVKNVYSDGETVRVNCMPGFTGMYRLKCEKGTWKTINRRPCAKKKCSNPGDIPHGDFRLLSGSEFVFGATVLYTCDKGFEMTSRINQRTCRDRGWDNTLPVCEAKQELCPDLSVENGLIYFTEEKVIYSCNTGYKTFTGNWWDSVTCSEGSWSEEPQCIPEDECGAFPSVHHGKLNQLKKIFHDGEATEFECDQGFIPTQRVIKCVNGTWETPVCEVGVHCGIPPKVENAFITSEPEELYVDGSRVTYICQKSFSIDGKGTVSCRNGIWEKTPTCKEKCGRPPSVNSADTTEMTKLEYNSGERVEYMCFSKFTLDQRPPYSKYLTCDEGEWKGNIRCLKPCTLTVEEMDRRGIQLYWVGNQKMFAPHEDHIAFACQRGKRLVNESIAFRQQCNDGVITLPECE